MRTRPTWSDWNERTPAPASSWEQRTPYWYNTPWKDEYYPWLIDSFPWLIENNDVDWNARLHPTYLYLEDWTPLLAQDYEIITI